MRASFLTIALCCLVQALSLAGIGFVRAEASPEASERPPVSRGLPWESKADTAPAASETAPEVEAEDAAAKPETTPDAASAAPKATESEASESEAAPAAEDAASGSDTEETAEDPASAAAAAPAPPHPVVAIIREKLADPTVTKGAEADDVAALQAFYRAWSGPPLWITEMGFSAKGQAALFEIDKADDWGLDAGAFALPKPNVLPANQQAQALGEIELDLAVLKYARVARGGREAPSEVSDLFDQIPALRDPKTVMAEIATAVAPGAYLQSLHPQHAQFGRLREALLEARAAEKPNQTDIRRLIINMERWRWMPEDLGALYVWLNTPEFMLYVVKDGKTIFEDKTLVGTIGYATPVFSDEMETIVFNPDWVAPPSVLQDKLWPALKRKSFNILKSNKLRVSYNGKRIDPTKINWQRVNIHRFTFSQKSGPKNVLGKAKFLYPNKHIVYMHDTLPYRRKVFDEKKRAIGYGCVRMAKPLAFAELMLAEDQDLPKSKVKALWDKGVNSSVTVESKPPVHTTYFTAAVDDDGKVSIFEDLYGLDRKQAEALFGEPEGFPKPPPEPKTRSSSVASSAPSRNSGAGFANSLGVLGN
ncbi:MAG TPA: L,D-transpeptidase family protein [Methyloceanibacter sp.]|nr:L,D-transpeptidase family protein [Methyloceanibacter sp.]